MIHGLFKGLYPHLDWIQVEISSHCSARCVYCPQHSYARGWESRQMSLPVFESLLPAFRKSRLIYLQGWGEPFAHPGFFDMLAMAKSAGCLTGTTISGTLIDEGKAGRLVESGIDVIAFSLAGAREANDRIRGEGQFDAVRRSIRHLRKAGADRKRTRPAVHVAYMLLRANMGDLEQMIGFFADAGVDQVVVSSLSLVTRRDLIREARLADSEAEWADLARRMRSLRELAFRKGVDMHFQLVSPTAPSRPCRENIGRALFVGSDGAVSPCVMTGIPAAAENEYYFNGNPLKLPRLSFGNIQDQPLNEIWQKPEYKKFRRSFSSGRLPAVCRQCLKSKTMEIQTPTRRHLTGLAPDI